MPRKIAGPCPTPGCPNLAGQCHTHTRQPRQARGYDNTHERLRAYYLTRMATGEHFDCWRCGKPIDPNMPWDLGHATRHTHAGPEHTTCNRATSTRRQ